MNLDPRIVQQEIANLLLQYPELQEDDQLRVDMIEGETEAFSLLSRIVRKIGENKALAEGTDAYAKEIGERSARIGRRVEAFRLLAFKIMEYGAIKKAELPEATLSIRAGAPKVIITDEYLLPPSCVRKNPTPDKTKIKDLLSKGEQVPGALLSNAETYLSIRIR